MRFSTAPLLCVVAACAITLTYLADPCAGALIVKSVHYTAYRSPTGVSGAVAGYCPSQSGGHTMMPRTLPFQTAAATAFNGQSFTNAVIGARNVFLSCSTGPCDWYFTTGFMNGSSLDDATFYRGVVYDGVDYGRSLPGVYNNFVPGFTPGAFSQAMFQSVPSMMQDNTWGNPNNRDDPYTQWVCEYYDMTSSEAATAPNTDSNGFILGFSENKGFPWWAGLIIAIGVVLIIVAAVITFCCCRKKRKEAAEADEVKEDMRRGDNLSRIPTQSQIGMSRASSTYRGANESQGRGADGMEMHNGAYGDGAIPQDQWGHGGNPFEGGHPQDAYPPQGLY